MNAESNTDFMIDKNLCIADNTLFSYKRRFPIS